mmetsp:Transcript_5771/g.17897  ORF Transcript_5771/g.17897 Transcript_5771/m.17897 type:complete len:368 (+) Transcript_5771:75-1178(+)
MSETKLFVGGIPSPNATDEQITELFTQNGAVPLEVVILPPKGSNPQTRCGFVRVPEEAALPICQALNGINFEGFVAPLVVRPADAQARTQPNGGSVGSTGGVRESSQPCSTGKVTVYSPAGAEPDVATCQSDEKQAAVAEGYWLEAAEWHEHAYAQAGESREAKLQRLGSALHAAVRAEHFYEAAAVYEAMAQIDPRRAATINAAAAAAAITIMQQGKPAHPVPQRASVAIPSDGPRVVPPPSPATFAAARTHGLGAGGRTASPRLPAPQAAAAGQEAARYSGRIVMFQAERHFGFIQCPELGCDAFLSEKQLGPFKVGDEVSFTVTYNANGKPQAQMLAPHEPEATHLAKRAKASACSVPEGLEWR